VSVLLHALTHCSPQVLRHVVKDNVALRLPVPDHAMSNIAIIVPTEAIGNHVRQTITADNSIGVWGDRAHGLLAQPVH
jgi:hypothetical protein